MNLKFFIFTLICALLWTFVTLRPKKKFIPKKHTCKPDQPCTKTPSYPKIAIKKMLNRNKGFQFLSGSVIEPLNETVILNYRAPADQEENMCKTRKVSMLPKTAFDTKKKLKYIVNVDDMKQVITYETCVDAGNSCYGNENWPNDIETFCKQSYAVIRLLSVSHAGKLEYAYFPVPSNCVCSYRKQFTYNFYD
nr:spaetzle-4 protein [Altica viridicyanea]